MTATLPEQQAHPDLITQALDKIAGLLEGQQTAARDAGRAERLGLLQAIHPIPSIPIGQITAASGAGSTLSLPDVSGPKTGKTWFVTRITAFGFTGGSVNVYYTNTGGTPVYGINQAGTLTFATSNFPVNRGQWLAFAAGSGFTGTAQIEIGVVEVDTEYAGAYLL